MCGSAFANAKKEEVVTSAEGPVTGSWSGPDRELSPLSNELTTWMKQSAFSVRGWRLGLVSKGTVCENASDGQKLNDIQPFHRSSVTVMRWMRRCIPERRHLNDLHAFLCEQMNTKHSLLACLPPENDIPPEARYPRSCLAKSTIKIWIHSLCI